MADARAESLRRRLDDMKSARSGFDTQWDELRRYMRPGDPAQVAANRAWVAASQGLKSRDRIWDSAPEYVSAEAAAAMMGLLMPAGTRWFRLEPEDDGLRRDAEVMDWCQHATGQVAAVIDAAESGGQQAIAQDLQQVLDQATGVLFVEERPGRLPLIRSRPVEECYLAEGEDGTVDTLYRNFRQTARQLVQRWGAGAVPERVRKAAEARLDETFELLHAIQPRAERRTGSRLARDMAFASVHVLLDEGVVLGESGYERQPFVAGRFRTASGEVYGRGPGLASLADIKMLNLAVRDWYRGISKAVDPAWALPDDGVVGRVDLNPGAVNYLRPEYWFNGRMPMAPLVSGGRPDYGEAAIQRMQANIERHYLLPVLRPVPNDPRMTATQVLRLTAQANQVLGAFVGRRQRETLNPLIVRLFWLEIAARRIRPAPAALADAGLRIAYRGQAELAQQLEQVAAITDTAEIVAQLAQIDPDVRDVIDADAAAREVGRVRGVSAGVIRPDAIVRRLREARNQAAAEVAQRQAQATDAAALQSAGQGAGALMDAGLLARPGGREAA